MIRELHVTTGKFSNIPKETLRVGICQENDFAEIRKRINYTLELKIEQGQNWWKYDKEQ